MSVFVWDPSYEATEVSKPRVAKTRFADGYEHRIRFGLNTNLKEWSLVFEGRTDAEREQIVSFFDERGGVESFDWTPPRGRLGKYICEEWQTTLQVFNFNTIRATFRQVPELVFPDVVPFALLLESGDSLTLENGGLILLEV
jgi:phage-related protein